MPVFRSAPTEGLAASIRAAISSLGSRDLSALQTMQADQAAADTAHKLQLVEQARASARKLGYEVDKARDEEARLAAERAAEPQRRLSFAANYAGMDHPYAERVMKAITGVRERPAIEVDDEGNQMPDVTFAVPSEVSPGQTRLFRNALALLDLNKLGDGKGNVEQLSKAAGNLQEQGIVQSVQDMIARGEYLGASAANQGAKPGTAIRLHDNIGDTGATFAPSTGAVASDPATQPGNKLLMSTLDQGAARTAQSQAAATASRAAAGASTAHADLFRAQADNERKRPAAAPAFKDVTTLRKEFNDQPEVKAYRDVLPILEAAKETPDTRAGDIQIAYAVGKILDPNSVVREGELKLVGEAATMDEALKGQIRSLVMGKGRLTPQTRSQLVAMLDNAAAQREASYLATERTYRGIAQQNGFPIDQVIIGPRKQNAVEAAKTPAATNAKGWKLMTDAAGNKAYVSPDGKSFEEVP